MTTLTITPNWKNKSARFKGTIAAGEHVAVSIANDESYIVDTTNLRLRVVNPANGKTLAQFPMPVEEGETPDEWNSDLTTLSCELDLNTVQMLMAVPPAANMPLLFVLDDYEGKTLFFKDFCEVTHWPRRVGEEEPTNLDDYKDIIAEFREDIYGEGGFKDRVESAETSAANSASAAQGAAQAAAESATAAQTAAESINGPTGDFTKKGVAADAKAVGDALASKADAAATSAALLALDSTKADESDLQAEVTRATAAEASLASQVSSLSSSVSGLSSGKADKATTLAGYGITDAKIANGTITLGSNSITPLTQHQSLAAYVNGGSYDSTNKKILLKNGSKTVAEIDVTAFLRYDLASETVIDTASQETVEGETVNYGAATLADRTGNRVSITAALDELRVTFPPTVSGKLRDFGLRVEVGTGSAALTAPALVPVAPTGETIKLENNAKQIPALADGATSAKGVTLLYFSESAPGVFFAKGEQVGEVA